MHGWLLRRQHLCMVIMAVAFVACMPLLEPAGWGERHPRTLHLLAAEAEAWARVGALQLQMPRA